MKRILVATDGSDHALKAAQLAGELAATMSAELHVLTVVYRNRTGEQELREFARIEHVEGGTADVALNLARSHVEQARRTAEAQGAIAIKTSVTEGDPTESSPMSLPKLSMPSWWGGEGEAPWRGCFSAACHRS